MQGRFLMGAAALLAGSLAWPANAQDAGADGQHWQQVVACTAEATSERRHACIDAVLRAAGALDPVREQAQQRAEFGRTERDVRPAPPVVAAAPPAPAQAAAPPAAPAPAPAPLPDRIDSISTTIAAARIGGNNRLLVATAEATVWRQLDGEAFRIPPSPGTAFEVRRGALGSYVCTVGRANTFRCARVD